MDGEKFVVLDISLKDHVKKSFFGKQQLTTGYQNKFKIGGLTNVFSLGPKVNVQFFAENNNFGTNEIELFMIKNLGDEAFAKMFKSNVVNYDEIKKEEAYHDEIYGFNNYITNDNAIVGFSINVPLSGKTDLYMGSFSNYHCLANKFLQQSWFGKGLIYDFQENNFLNEYNTKNKIQIKYTADKWKWNANANYVYVDQNVGNNTHNEYFNQFRKKHFSSNWYFNNHLEYVITPKLGLLSVLSYSQEHYNIHSRLYTNRAEIYSFLGVHDFFAQQNKNVQSMGNAKIGMVYKSENWGTHSLGYRYHSNHLKNEKISNSGDFNAADRVYQSVMHTLYYNHDVYWGDLQLKTDLGYAFVDFPYQENEVYVRKNREYFQYKFHGRYNLNRMFSLGAEYSRQLGAYPLSKATFGDVLMDFQTIYRTSQVIAPFYNSHYQFFINMDLGRDRDSWIIYERGTSDNKNNQTFNENFIFFEANQLSSNYHVFSSTYKDKIKKWNFQYIFEPEFIFNTSEYLRNHRVEPATTYRYLAGLKLFYTPKSKKVSIFYYPKYTHLMFRNTTTDKKTNFNFLSNKIELGFYFLQQKLKAEIGYKQVNFLQNRDSFNNLDVQLVYKTVKNKWFVSMGNLFNSKNFTTQDFNQSLLNIQQNRVFDRYVNVGFEMKMN